MLIGLIGIERSVCKGLSTLYPTVRVDMMSLPILCLKTKKRAVVSFKRKTCARLRKGEVETLVHLSADVMSILEVG